MEIALGLEAAWAEAETSKPEGYRIMLWESLGRNVKPEQRYVAKLKDPSAWPMGYHYGATPAEAIRKMVAAAEWEKYR